MQALLCFFVYDQYNRNRRKMQQHTAKINGLTLAGEGDILALSKRKRGVRMKRGWIVLLVLLMLTGCGQSNGTAAANKTEQPAVQENAAAQADATEAIEEELYVEELDLQGMKITDYYRGGKDGILVRTEWEDPEGRHGVQTFWDNGMMATSITYDLDGSIHEEECYTNGTAKISIFHEPDGSVQENHYADDGIVEEADGMISFLPGTQTYGRTLDANGTMVREMIRNEDGTSWEWGMDESGCTWEVHFSVDGYMTKTVSDDPANGWHSETEFYIDGSRKLQEDIGEDGSYRLYEFYADGKKKHVIQVDTDGTKLENMYNHEGLLTYSYSKNLSDEREFVTDEGGKLIKYTENGTVYEANQIPEDAALTFERMQQSQ